MLHFFIYLFSCWNVIFQPLAVLRIFMVVAFSSFGDNPEFPAFHNFLTLWKEPKFLARIFIGLPRLIYSEIYHWRKTPNLKVFDSHHWDLWILITKVPFTPYRGNYSCRLPPNRLCKWNCENYETHVAIFPAIIPFWKARLRERRKMHTLNKFTSHILPFPLRVKRDFSQSNILSHKLFNQLLLSESIDAEAAVFFKLSCIKCLIFNYTK